MPVHGITRTMSMAAKAHEHHVTASMSKRVSEWTLALKPMPCVWDEEEAKLAHRVHPTQL